MKPIFFVLLFCSLLLLSFSCKKSSSNKPGYAETIVGSWELRQTSAAMNPTVGTFAPGNGNIIKFTPTEYEIYNGAQLVKKGQYTIVPDPTVESSVCLLFPVGQFTNRIIYDGDTTSNKTFLQITNNRMAFVAGCYAVDAGHRAEYEKVEG